MRALASFYEARGLFSGVSTLALAQPPVDVDDRPVDVLQWASAVVEALRAALGALNETDPLVMQMERAACCMSLMTVHDPIKLRRVARNSLRYTR